MDRKQVFQLVGKVREAHGLKGDLYVLVFSEDISWLKKLTHFELKTKSGTVTTYQVERVKPFKKGFIVKAEGIDDRNASEIMKGQEFFIPSDLLVSKPGETIFLGEIMDFTVKNLTQEKIGHIVGFSSNGPQDLLVVETGKGRIEIPFVEAFIKKIDFKHQSIIMDLPEGLLDLENL